MRIEIVRDRVEAEGVFGTMHVDGEYFCRTVERPWLSNKAFISCITAGAYDLVPWDSPKFGPVVAFVNPALHIYLDAHDVSDPQARDKCLIHAANYPHELNGCVAIGAEVVNFPHHGFGVANSRRALERLRSRWKDRSGMTAVISWSDAMRPAQ